jgi:hypothetical protein
MAVSVGVLLKGSCNSVAAFSNKKNEEERANNNGNSKYQARSYSAIDNTTVNK